MLVPESSPDLIIEYAAKQYVGQFSADGSFFITGGNDLKLRMYDTSNPYKWKFYKVRFILLRV